MEENIDIPDMSGFVYESEENHAKIDVYPHGSLATPVERAAWDMYYALCLICDSIEPYNAYGNEKVNEAIRKARGGHDFMKVCQKCNTAVCYDKVGIDYVNHNYTPFLCTSCANKERGEK